MEVCDWQCTREAIRDLGKALGCGVCDKPLQEPCTLGSCNHLFCRSCADVHLGNVCPICHAPAWVKDLQLKRELASVVGLYNKLCTTINQDVETGENKADIEEVTTATGQPEGRHVEIEIIEQRVVNGCSSIYNASVAMEMEVVTRKALHPRNVSHKMKVSQSVIQKKKLKKSGPVSFPGGRKKQPKDDEIVRRCALVQENGKSKPTATSSSSSENELMDPMSVYDFVPSPLRPKPVSKKRARKPNRKAVKRHHVAAANRRWLRGDALSKLGEESESGFDSERSLKHVSFSIDMDLGKTSVQDSSSLESMDVSSQDEIPASVADDCGVMVEETSGGTQESGYSTGSNLDASSLVEREQLPPCNGKVSSTSNGKGTLYRKTQNQKYDDHKKQTKHSVKKTERVSQASQAFTSAPMEMELCAITTPKQKLTRRNQDNAESANPNNQTDNQMPPPKMNNKNLAEASRVLGKRRREVIPKQPSKKTSRACSTGPDKAALSPPKRRRGRVQETLENIGHQLDIKNKRNGAKAPSDTRTENLSPENLQSSRQTRKRDLKKSSTPPSIPQTSRRDTSSPQEMARGLQRGSGTPSPSEKHRSSRTTTMTSPRNGSAVAKRNKRGETPLHVAVIKGDVDTARQLLQEGADPNAKDNAGWTPLHEASNHGHALIVAVLLDHGALVNTPGFEHDSPLHDAIMNHRLDVVKLLLLRGASLDVRNMHGLTPADYANSEPMRAALETKPLVAMATKPTVTASQKSVLSRNQPVVLLGTGLKDAGRKQLQACAKLLGGGRVVSDFGSEVTHLVASCNHDDLCMRTMKYLNAILSGVWVVSFEWITECLQTKSRAPEIEFEVKGTIALPTSSGPEKGRTNAEQQLPHLLDGCHFYLHGTFSPPTPSKQEIGQLIRNGGGTILNRQPKPDDDIIQSSTTIPYHMRPGSELATCSYYIIHDHIGGRAPSRIRTGKLSTAPVSWLMDCISQFELLDLPD